MRATFATLAVLTLLVSVPGAQTKPAAPAASKTAKTFDIYLSDTEGGKATLFVSPSGESVTRRHGQSQPSRHGSHHGDAGRGRRQRDRLPDPDALPRRPRRRLAGAGQARHDQALRRSRAERRGAGASAGFPGGVRRTPSARPSTPSSSLATSCRWRDSIGASSRRRGRPSRPRSQVAGSPIRRVPASRRAPRSNDPENGQSVGSVIAFGKFRTIDLGDLLWDKEKDFMCPNNLVGPVDLYIVSHHGTDPSGSPALVHGLQPRVAISQNGTRKGGTLQTSQTLNSSPGFQDHWQLHWSYNGRTEHNPAGLFIANIDEPDVIAAVLTAPPGGGRGGPGGPGGGAPPAAAGWDSTSRCGRTARRRRHWRAGCRDASCGSARPAARRRGTAASGSRRVNRVWLHRPARRRQRAAKAVAAAGWPWRATHRSRVHDQGVCSGRRHLHRHQHAQRFQQNLQTAVAFSRARRRVPAGDAGARLSGDSSIPDL